jgi:hypothetical protein
MGVPFLDALLGKLYSQGSPRELRGALNFTGGLALKASEIGWDVTLDPEAAAASIRETQEGFSPDPLPFPALAVELLPDQMARIEARYHGRSGSGESFVVLLAYFRRVGEDPPTQWGETITGTYLVDDFATSGNPGFAIVGNTVTPQVEGAEYAIEWTIDTVVRAY